jgi:hypothetical protein
MLGTHAASAAPVIFNQPFTARPGDIISVEGKGFGATPSVNLTAVHQGRAPQVKILRAEDNVIAFQVPPTLPFDVYQIAISDGRSTSSPVSVNVPRAMHFDTPEVASSTRFRIFGRNLFLAPTQPTVSLVDPQTKLTLSASVVLNASDAYSLTVIAPNSLIPGRTYQVVVSNGFGAANADQTLLARAAGNDPFQLGVPWGGDFVTQNGPGYHPGVPGTNEADHHVFDVTRDPDLAIHAKGDGIADDKPAIQAAIDRAAQHGGLVYLPAGTYRLASTGGAQGLALRSHVVLQGHSADDTKIVYCPPGPQPSGYMFFAISWPANVQQSGLADVSLVNIDHTSLDVVNALASGPASELFIQRVNWDLGSGQSLFLANVNKLALENSTIHQAINSQNPHNPPDSIGLGPIFFDYITNAIIRSNDITWATGQNLINDLANSIIESNHFTRSASDKIVAGPNNLGYIGGDQRVSVGETIQRTQGRQLSINFAKDIVLQNNIFDVSDGILKYNWYDGEAILSEGGGPFPRSDSGTVTWFAPQNLTDDTRCRGCGWNYHPNSMIQLVSGRGAGQLRHITGLFNNTFTIDRPWDIQPAIGDHFAIFVESFENTLIHNNILQGNPAGVVLYDGAYLNTAIVGNQFVDNGGTYIRGSQRPSGQHTAFSTVRNIEIRDNVMRNTKGLYPAYIVANFAMILPNKIWGNSFDGIEIRNNSITADPRTPTYLYPEGYMNYLYYQNMQTPFADNGLAAITGTVFQGNTCVNCPIDYAVDTGVDTTIIWNATNNPIFGGLSQSLADRYIWNTATHPSTGTVTGHD